MNFHRRILCICALLMLAMHRPAHAAVTLPSMPKLPDFTNLLPYTEPSVTEQRPVIKNLIQDFRTALLLDLPGFIARHKDLARRVSQHQFLLQSPDGRELVYLTENKGLIDIIHHYWLLDEKGQKLDGQRSYQIAFSKNFISYSNQDHLTLAIATDDPVRLSAYGGMLTADLVYKVWWDKNGGIRREDKTAARDLQPRPVKIASTAFLKGCAPGPYPGKFDLPQQSDYAQALQTTLRAMDEDLREIADVVGKGQMTYTTGIGAIVGKHQGPDGRRSISISIMPDLRRMARAEIKLYERTPEISEAVLRASAVALSSNGEGIASYMLRTPQMEAWCQFNSAHHLTSFFVDFLSRNERGTVLWDNEGKLKLPETPGKAPVTGVKK